MRQFIYLAETLNEAPIGDLNVIGDPQPGRWGGWTGQQKVGMGNFTQGDKTLLTNPKSVKRIRDAFEKTPFVFDFYVFLSGDVGADLPWTKDKLESILGNEIDNAGKITVVYTNNSTNLEPGSYMPMNAWALAHRMAHDFQINRERSNPAEDRTWERLCAIWNIAYGDSNGKFEPASEVFTKATGGPGGQDTMTKFVNMVFSMRSARNERIQNELDVFPEAFAQFLLTGKVRLNRVAQWDVMRFAESMPYLYRFDANELLIPEEKHAAIDALLEESEAILENAITALLQSMVGGVYGW